jgi:NitT/TauT family transport system substrate-binding protein
VQVGSCSNSIGCFNALQRGVDLKIVGGLSLAGQTEKSRGSGALVVRPDLWESGAIREPRDLSGRTVYLVAGAGSGQHAPLARWLRQHGVDPHSIEVQQMLFPDMLAAMSNRAIELAMQSEPLLTAGLTRGLHRTLATIEEMHPTVQTLYVMYYGGIDRLGPRAGERFMVGWLRGVRDYINAFEHGVEQDAIIDILTRETIIKDPAVYRQIKFAWVDPNGVFARTALQGDADLFHELGLMGPLDLTPTFDDRYRQFAVDYLGEYRPPR